MTPKRKRQLDHVFMAMAEDLSTMSLATRLKVGALIVKDGNIKSVGWNGMPSGFPNGEIELKSGGEIITNPLVLHAESNAILKCAAEGSSSAGADIYMTMSPCLYCAKLIIQAKITKVFYRDQYRLTDGLDVLKRAKIPCVQLNPEDVQDVHTRSRPTAKVPVRRQEADAARRPHKAPKQGLVKRKDRP